MTETPEPAPETGGWLARLERLVAERFGPDIADCRIKAENADIKAEKALAWLKDHAANASKLADLVTEAVKLTDPADASAMSGLVSEAEAIAAEAARIAAEVLAEV